MNLKAAVLVVLVGIFLSGVCSAQEPIQKPRTFKNAVFGLLGTAGGSQSTEVEDYFTGQGFDVTSNKTGISVTPSWTICYTRSMSRAFGFGVLFSTTTLGETMQQDLNASPSIVFPFHYQVDTIAPLIVFQTGDLMSFANVQLGVGPTLSTVKARLSSVDPFGGSAAWISHTKAGLEILADVMIPARSRVFGIGAFEYRYLGKQSMDLNQVFSGDFPPFPPFVMNFRHWQISGGAGIRF